MLKILRQHNNTELPKDARTLLQTPATVQIDDLAGGNYCYLGIKKGLERLVGQNLIDFSQNCLDLQINIDGLPIFKSSSLHLWPILCKFGSHPFLVGLWAGHRQKPDDSNIFVRDFLEERQLLIRDGVQLSGQHFQVVMNKIICDAPARAMLKGTKQFSGYNSCDRCEIIGTYEERRVCFPECEVSFSKRTNEKFSQYRYLGGYQLKRTIFSNYTVNCVTDFLLDSMHLVYLGVVKRLLEFLKSGPRSCKISRLHIDQVSARLQKLKGQLPREFAR